MTGLVDLGRLRAAKLKALTRGRVAGDAAPVALPSGAAMVVGDAAWVLLADDAGSSLGAALAWGRRSGAASLHVVVDDSAAEGAAGLVARRATLVDPAPEVWRVRGDELLAAEASVVEPVGSPPRSPELVSLLEEAGLSVVTEGDAILGELLGLEVARIVSGPDGPALEVGVGRFDRELTEMAHAHLAPADRLMRAVEIVARYRRPGAPPHPLNQLVPERWMRAAVVADPSLVEAAGLRPVPSAVPRPNLKATWVASAVGVDATGGPVVVTCSTGVDLDLVPAAADDRAARAPGARLVLAVPARDALPVTVDLARRLADPADVVAIDGDWRIPWA